MLCQKNHHLRPPYINFISNDFPTSLAKEMKEAASSPTITVEVEQKIQITETEIEEEIELPLPVQEYAVKRVDGKDFIEFILFSLLCGCFSFLRLL